MTSHEGLIQPWQDCGTAEIIRIMETNKRSWRLGHRILVRKPVLAIGHRRSLSP